MKNDDVKIPFGKYKGLRFKDVPLEYLDWLVGWLEETKSKRNPRNLLMDEFPTIYRCAIEYLKDNHYGEDNASE